MKFQLYLPFKSFHAGFASCVCWVNNELVITCGDDRKLLFWNSASFHEPARSVQLPIEAYPTSMHVLMSSSNGATGMSIDSGSSTISQSSHLIALGASNGLFYLFPLSWNSNRLDKCIEAHTGAVIVIRWSNDNSTLATGGEDGLIKIWSRAGMLRSTITGSSLPLYALTWSPDSNSLAYGNANQLVVKSLSPQSKSLQWLAHEGLVTSLHWSALNALILSASEDARVKMWDSSGRLLFVSAVNSTVPSAVSWSADGELFAICTFNTVKLHDSSGTCLSVEKLSSEGIHALSWSPDSNQLCLVCSTGQVIFAYVVQKVLDWAIWQAVNTSRRTIKVTNCTNDVGEMLDFRDSILRVSFAYNYLVVVTASQCFIYQTTNWTTPHHFDVKNMDVVLIKQCQRYFLLMTANSANLYNYDGRFVRTIKLLNMRLESIRSSVVSLNNNTLAYRDGLNSQTIHLTEIDYSKSIASKEKQTSLYRHLMEIVTIQMSPESNQGDQICAFLDKNSDLYIVSVSSAERGSVETFKLSTMINDFIWHSECNILASLHDNQSLTLWLFPNVAFIDSGLLQDVLLIVASDELTSKNSRITAFDQNQLTVERLDKVKVYIPVNPFVGLLHKLKRNQRWEEAVKMCNFLDKSVQGEESIDRSVCNALWATLAAMAMEAKQFSTAEIAYAAVNKLDKVLYLNRIKTLTLPEARAAELELMCGNIASAEQYFLQKGFVFRAVLLNLELFRWKRALELAEKYNAKFVGITVEGGRSSGKLDVEIIEEEQPPIENNLVTLIHLVLACRQSYLKNKYKVESIKEFKVLFNEVDHLVDWADLETILRNNDKLLYMKSS